MKRALHLFLLIPFFCLVDKSAFGQEETRTQKFQLGPFISRSVYTAPSIEAQARTTSVFNAVGVFEARKASQTNFGAQLQYHLSERSQFKIGLGIGFQNFEFGYERILKGERGVNSSSDYGIEKSISSWIIPIEWSKQIKAYESFSLWLNMGVGISIFNREQPWLFWKNSEYMGFSSENMSYFAYLESSNSIVINPKIGLQINRRLLNGKSLQFGLNYLAGVQQSLEGEFTFVAIRPFEAFPDRVEYSTDYQAYFGTDASAYDERYDMDYKGGQLQIKISYLFNLGGG